jgi:hypothetical protein
MVDGRRCDPGMPTVRVDQTLVTELIKADLLENIEGLTEIATSSVSAIYQASLQATLAGGDLHTLTNALTGIGIKRRRAAEISRYLWFNAMALIEAERREKLGICFAIWRYSGAPCGNPTQDAAHRAADGKRFPVTEGLRLNGQFTLPGRQLGCKCSSSVVIPGLE